MFAPLKPQLCLLFIWLVTSCANNVEPIQTFYPSAESAPPTLTPGANQGKRWVIYSPDPNHLWNRMFRQFFARTASDGTEYGWYALDPLLWPETTYLLEGESHKQSIQLLDEFISARGEELIHDPLKRAVFQRDMWSVFDWLAFQYDDYPVDHPTQRRELQERIVKVIQKLALSKQEIESLPDNFREAIESGIFATQFQSEHPSTPFLPADFYSPDSGWVSIGRKGGPIAMTHTNGFPFLGRSVFLVYIRVPVDTSIPGGKSAAWELLNSMNTISSPDLPDGTEVALVRRVLLIDTEGEIVLSPLVASIQLRHFVTSGVQNFYEFQVITPLLFEGTAGGLQPVEKEIGVFMSHGDVFQIGFIHEAEIPEKCQGCHIDTHQGIVGINSILSYSRKRFLLPDNQKPVLIETTPESEAENVIAWKLMDRTWRELGFLWQQARP